MRAQVEALATYSLSFDDRVKFSIKYDPWVKRVFGMTKKL